MSNPCSCIIDMDYDPPDFYHDEYRKAGRMHVCCECGDDIQVGERHHYATGKTDDSWWDARTCILCDRIRGDLCCSFEFGRLREAIKEVLGMDYVTGESIDDDDEVEEVKP